MRPPMGGGAGYQANTKGSGSMGFLMPLYTIGIVAFFVYTIMKVFHSFVQWGILFAFFIHYFISAYIQETSSKSTLC